MRVHEVLRDDGLGMARVVAVDVRDGHREVVDDAHGEDEVAVLRRPVLLRRRLHLRADGARPLAAAQHDVLCRHRRHELRQELRCDVLMDEQRLHGIADRATAGLRVDSDRDCHLLVGRSVDIGVADVREVDELDGALGDARLVGSLGKQGADGDIRADGLRTAAQDDGVAGLEAEPRGIGRDIRARLVDDADDAERHAHAADLEAIGADRRVVARRNGVRQGRRLAQALRHRGDAALVEQQAVEVRALDLLLARVLDVERIGLQDDLAALLERVSHRQKRLVLDICAEQSELCRCALRRLCLFLHFCLDIHLSIPPQTIRTMLSR